MIRKILGKYKFVIVLQLAFLAVLLVALAVRGRYGLTLSKDMLVFTPQAAEDGFASAGTDSLLMVSVPDGTDLDSYSACIWSTDIPFGVYSAEVRYSTSYDTGTENRPLVRIITFDESGDTSAFSDDICLYSHKTAADTRIYSGIHSGSFYSYFILDGSGEASVESLVIREYMPWRLMVFLAALLFFLFIDGCIAFLSGQVRERIFVFASLSILAAVISVPLMTDHAVFGHDLSFHMNRVASLGEELMHGHFPVRYMSDAYYGHGYIIDVFYANILLLPAAIIYLLGTPLYAAYDSYLIILGLITVIASYYSFRGVFGEPKWGVLGAYLYSFSTYRLCDLYVRSDAGELSAMAFLPLIVLGIYRIYSSEKRDYRSTIPLVIGIFGVVQSHILSVLLVAYFLLLFCVCALPRTIKKLPELLFSFVWLLVIDAFYLVPVFASYAGMGMSTSRALHGDLPGGALNFLQILDPCFVYGTSETAKLLPNEMHFGAGPLAYAGIVLFVISAVTALAGKKKESGNVMKTGAVCLSFGILAAFISSSLFPWGKISGAGGVWSLFTCMQFPWRFMEIADVMFVFAAVSGAVMACRTLNRKMLCDGLVIILAAVSMLTGISFSHSYRKMYYQDRSVQRGSFSAIRPDWTYFPEGLNSYLSYDTGLRSASGAEVICMLSGTAEEAEDAITYEVHTSESDVKEYLILNGGADDTVILPVFALDNIIVTDNETGKRLAYGRSEGCKVTLPVTAGSAADIRLEYGIPPLWRVFDIVSLAGLIILCIIYRRICTNP